LTLSGKYKFKLFITTKDKHPLCATELSTNPLDDKFKSRVNTQADYAKSA